MEFFATGADDLVAAAAAAMAAAAPAPFPPGFPAFITNGAAMNPAMVPGMAPGMPGAVITHGPPAHLAGPTNRDDIAPGGFLASMLEADMQEGQKDGQQDREADGSQSQYDSGSSGGSSGSGDGDDQGPESGRTGNAPSQLDWMSVPDYYRNRPLAKSDGEAAKPAAAESFRSKPRKNRPPSMTSADGEPVEPGSEPKKKRGRPPKPKPPVDELAAGENQSPEAVVVKRKPGRPRKDSYPPQSTAAAGVPNLLLPEKRPVRPPAHLLSGGDLEEAIRAGIPIHPRGNVTASGEDAEAGGSARAPTAAEVAFAAAVAASGMPLPQEKKKRGRPSKSATPAVEGRAADSNAPLPEGFPPGLPVDFLPPEMRGASEEPARQESSEEYAEKRARRTDNDDAVDGPSSADYEEDEGEQEDAGDDIKEEDAGDDDGGLASMDVEAAMAFQDFVNDVGGSTPRGRGRGRGSRGGRGGRIGRPPGRGRGRGGRPPGPGRGGRSAYGAVPAITSSLLARSRALLLRMVHAGAAHDAAAATTQAASAAAALAGAADGDLAAAAALAPNWAIRDPVAYRALHYAASVAVETHDWDVVRWSTVQLTDLEETCRRAEAAATIAAATIATAAVAPTPAAPTEEEAAAAKPASIDLAPEGVPADAPTSNAAATDAQA